MDDISVHYESTKSLVTIGDGGGASGPGADGPGTSIPGTNTIRTVYEKSPPTLPTHHHMVEREPTVNEILQHAGVKLEKAIDQGYYL